MGTAATEEVLSASAVNGEGSRYETVEEAEPEKERSRELARQLRAHQSAHKMVDAPEQLRAGPRDRTRGDLVKAAEEIAVATARVAIEVVRTRMHLLKKGCLRVGEAVFPKHSVNLLDHVAWLEHVLEYGLDDDSIHARVGQGDLVGVGDELGHWAAVDVERDQAESSVGVECLDAVSDRAATDHEHDRCRSRAEGTQRIDVAMGATVRGDR